jgi:hypothetical protein
MNQAIPFALSPLRLIVTITVLLITSAFLTGCNGCNNKPASRVLSWGVLDKTTNVNTNLADGGSFKINGNDNYLITLQVQDPDGIREMDVSGSGNFTCSVELPNLQEFTVPNPVSVAAAVPKQVTTIPSAGSFQGFVMSSPVVYYKISCGKFSFANAPPNLEYFATSGPLVMKGVETSWPGTVTNATLSLNP